MVSLYLQLRSYLIKYKQERNKRRNEASSKSKALESKIQKNILESHLLGLKNNEMDSIQKTNSESNKLVKQTQLASGMDAYPSSSSRVNEIDDDMFKLPEKSNLPLKRLSDDEYANDFDDDIDDEIIHLTNSENIPTVSKTIDFNSYFIKNELNDSETFFKV